MFDPLGWKVQDQYFWSMNILIGIDSIHSRMMNQYLHYRLIYLILFSKRMSGNQPGSHNWSQYGSQYGSQYSNQYGNQSSSSQSNPYSNQIPRGVGGQVKVGESEKASHHVGGFTDGETSGVTYTIKTNDCRLMWFVHPIIIYMS